MAPSLTTLGDPHKYTKFLPLDAMLAWYRLRYGPVFLRSFVCLGAEGPRGAKSCRGTCVETSSSMQPIATADKHLIALFLWADGFLIPDKPCQRQYIPHLLNVGKTCNCWVKVAVGVNK